MHLEHAKLALDQLRAKFKPAQWASYFTYHLVQRLAFAMPRPIDDAAFELTRLLTGVEKQRERGKRCIEHTTAALGELLGQVYVASYFPASSKQAATGLVDALVRAMTDDISGLDWMADVTKQLALAKLDRIVRMVGYPDHWRSYSGYEVKADDLFGNVWRSDLFDYHYQVGRIGTPTDRSTSFIDGLSRHSQAVRTDVPGIVHASRTCAAAKVCASMVASSRSTHSLSCTRRTARVTASTSVTDGTCS